MNIRALEDTIRARTTAQRNFATIWWVPKARIPRIISVTSPWLNNFTGKQQSTGAICTRDVSVRSSGNRKNNDSCRSDLKHCTQEPEMLVLLRKTTRLSTGFVKLVDRGYPCSALEIRPRSTTNRHPPTDAESHPAYRALGSP